MARQASQFAEHAIVRAVRNVLRDCKVKPDTRRSLSSKRHSRWLGLEALEPRLLMSGDLIVNPPSLTSIGAHAPGESVEVAALVRNIGDAAVAAPIKVDLYGLTPTPRTHTGLRSRHCG